MTIYQVKIKESLVDITYNYCRKNNLTGYEARPFVSNLLESITPESRPTVTAICMATDRRIWSLQSL